MKVSKSRFFRVIGLIDNPFYVYAGFLKSGQSVLIHRIKISSYFYTYVKHMSYRLIVFLAILLIAGP